MRVLIITPAPRGSTKGNRITADRWAILLERLGHKVDVAEKIIDAEFDCLVALHATRSHDALVDFQKLFPERPTILCLTGTDLHLDLQKQRGDKAFAKASDSIDRCSHIVLLEPQSINELPAESRRKVTVILQSATPVEPKPLPNPDIFEISVVGHLRDEKDPFLAARAARWLPSESRIVVTHAGAALQPDMKRTAETEVDTNPRYRWLGSVPHDQAQQLIARSRLMVLTSKVEGAPSAISEAIVNGVPILATRIPATIGLLGDDYPGLFPVGDDQRLAELMSRAESNPMLFAGVQQWINRLSPQFSPAVEQNSLQRLLASIS